MHIQPVHALSIHVPVPIQYTCMLKKEAHPTQTMSYIEVHVHVPSRPDFFQCTREKRELKKIRELGDEARGLARQFFIFYHNDAVGGREERDTVIRSRGHEEKCC